MSGSVFEDYIGLSMRFWDHYLQTEAGTIKRVSLPTSILDFVLHLTTHCAGRSPSHLDTETRARIDKNPSLTYGEALLEVIHAYADDPVIQHEMSEVDEERDQRDRDDFNRLLDAREEVWRTENDYWHDELPPALN